MRIPFGFCVLATLILLGGCSSGPAPVAKTPPGGSTVKAADVDRASLREAQMLSNAHRYGEAAVIYEALLKGQPEDGDLTARLANMLSMQGREEKDSAKAKALNKRARALAERAEKLGTKDPMPLLIIASTNRDGTKVETQKGAFSKREQVDELMRQGEAAFGSHDFSKAGECYQKAFELEPTNYIAALYSGDAYFSGKDMVKASEWFRKAIAISPDSETAHRYLGDALDRLGRRKDAFDEWIAALICSPYERTTRQHFTDQLRARAEAKGRVTPRFPAMRSSIKGKEIKISVGPEDGPLIMAYNLMAITWRDTEFQKRFPNEKAPRRSLPEEIAAIEAMLEVAEGTKDEEKEAIKKWVPTIEGLKVLKSDGLLEAYVFLERADEGLIKDYAGYRAAHRAELERYIRRYWCGMD